MPLGVARWKTSTRTRAPRARACVCVCLGVLYFCQLRRGMYYKHYCSVAISTECWAECLVKHNHAECLVKHNHDRGLSANRLHDKKKRWKSCVALYRVLSRCNALTLLVVQASATYNSSYGGRRVPICASCALCYVRRWMYWTWRAVIGTPIARILP